MKNSIKDNNLLPLYKANGIPHFIPTAVRKNAISRFNQKLKEGIYKFVDSQCICGNRDDGNDICYTEKDLWGIPNLCKICNACGLIYSAQMLDENSLNLFYNNEYKEIYYDSTAPSLSLLLSQKVKGDYFKSLLESHDLLSKIESIFDFGGGSGGALLSFKELGKKVQGCDFGQEYIDFGNVHGLNMYYGGISEDKTSKNSIDLIILSHVWEHFLDPLGFFREIDRFLKMGGYLILEVPGLYAKDPYKYYPIWHNQMPHVVNFYYREFLILYFESLGLKVIYGDDRCTFILQKANELKLSSFKINTSSLKGFNLKNLNYLLMSHSRFEKKFLGNKIKHLKKLLIFSNKIGMRSLLGLILPNTKNLSP